ncbi:MULTISPECIES: type I polyketide synthase [Streptomyces]|uniref:Polyketide synthase n=1 Tax=Streptomyces pyridomyceticus TaxID=68260 RepID=F6K7G7_9ACTN|nr:MULTISPECIES: type I polyketide synthase [Streptomyces]AEF33079.1 polyketide synthase [Streptomyces pyridomyceticus]
MADDSQTVRDLDIAIVAMEGRFPGARDVAQFWANLVAGEESVRPVGDEEYLAAGGDPAALGDRYAVKAAAAMDDADLFDADFFGLRADEAETMDPQQRVFLEVCHHALEQSGHDPDRFDGVIGVYGGASQSRYYLSHVRPRLDESAEPLRAWTASMGNDPGVFATRVAYALNLTGPALTVQTACSTSLAAIHLACQDLLSYRCDVALAGGSSINPAAKRGYRHTPDGPFSPDGHVRAFDARAEGMVPGDATAVVVLKRLTDAVADGDRIRAVIKGTAVNNDGSRKVGFTAPSPLGQAEVVLAAHAAAEVDADTIGYVEAHGTGTPVGDPIEFAALTQAFAETTTRTGFCALGSVKTNIGHTDAAAGVVGLIKAALVVEHGTIPPTLHYTSPNPLIDLDSSPFHVNDRLTEWPAGPTPRRAGVSSFGIGGTNAHAVLEEPPAAPARGTGEGWVLLPWSARSAEAADRLGALLGDHLARTPDLALGDVAHTLRSGRRTFAHRRFAVCRDRDGAVAQLVAPGHAAPPADGPTERPVAFLFPGGGAQYDGMGRGLYETEPVFRETLDRCAAILEPVLGFDVRAALHRGEEGPRSSLLPGLVSTEYALATLLMSRGVRPQSLIGHSAGEYTAACLAGVMSLEDMLPLVAKRQWLLERAGGVAVSVRLGERDLDAYLTERLSLATVNAPALCTVSGPEEDVRELEARWDAEGVEYQRVHFPSAVHSWLLDSVLDDYAAALAEVTLRPPAIPFVSNVSGTWITDAEATSPDYWLRHTRRTVRFADGLTALRAGGEPVLVEVGPGRILTRCAQLQFGDAVPTVETMRHPRADQHDQQVLLTALGRLWQLGARLTWDGENRADEEEGQGGRRVPLPGYPFERKRYWLDEVRPAATASATASAAAAGRGAVRDLAEAERELRRSTDVSTVPARLREDFDRLAALRAAAFLRTAGVDTTAGRTYTPEDLVGRLRPAGPYRKLLDALLHMLRESGVLAREGDLLRFTGSGADAAEEARLTRSVTERHPSLAKDLELLDTCLAGCADVLRGDTDGTAVLTPDGRTDLTAGVLETHMDEGDFALYRTLLAEHVAELARAAGGRPFRILEAGAGRGRLTWTVAEALRGIPGVRYHVTDLGRSFVLEAEREAARRGIDFMSFGVLDIGQAVDPVALGGAFDVVLAFNVLHIPADLRECTRHVRRLLAPGGLLCALETVRMPWASELSVGLLPQWWAFADDLRRNSPILPADRWRELLVSEGFDEVRVLSDDRADQPLIPHALIVGRRPAASAAEPATAEPATARPTAGSARTPEETGTGRQPRPALGVAHRAPSTDTERVVARHWEELLRVDGIGADDNFFDLGGESLLALQLVTRLRDELGVELRVKKLMEKLTVAAMATEADALRGNADTAPRITPSARRGRRAG